MSHRSIGRILVSEKSRSEYPHEPVRPSSKAMTQPLENRQPSVAASYSGAVARGIEKLQDVGPKEVPIRTLPTKTTQSQDPRTSNMPSTASFTDTPEASKNVPEPLIDFETPSTTPNIPPINNDANTRESKNKLVESRENPNTIAFLKRKLKESEEIIGQMQLADCKREAEKPKSSSLWGLISSNDRDGHDMVMKLNSEVNKLSKRVDKYRTERNECREESNQFKIALEKQDQDRQAYAKNATAEKQQLEEQIAILKEVHVKSTTAMGGTLHTLTDEEAQKRLSGLRDSIEDWTRSCFKGQPRKVSLLSPTLDKILSNICLDYVRKVGTIGFGDLAQAVVWNFLETRIFSTWLAGFNRGYLLDEGYMAGLPPLEAYIRNALSSNRGKAEEWRAYTISLICQSPIFQHEQQRWIFELVKELDALLSELVDSKKPANEHRESLYQVVWSAVTLALDFRRQSSLFGIDMNVRPGDIYEPTFMEEIGYLEEEEELQERKAQVIFVRGRGWIKRDPATGKYAFTVCRAKVRVSPQVDTEEL